MQKIDTEPFHEIFRGLRVPWVAQWTEEVSHEPLQKWEYAYDYGVRYANERPEDRQLGVLWMRTQVNRGGVPQFAQFNVYRQRDAMLHGLCQVCGMPTAGSWLISAPEPRPSGRPFTTATPPTCAGCIEIAREICPHLSKNQTWRLQVRGQRPWAVYGDVVTRYGSKVIHSKGEIRLADEASKSRIMARQLTVELWDYRRIKED